MALMHQCIMESMHRCVMEQLNQCIIVSLHHCIHDSLSHCLVVSVNHCIVASLQTSKSADPFRDPKACDPFSALSPEYPPPGFQDSLSLLCPPQRPPFRPCAAMLCPPYTLYGAPRALPYTPGICRGLSESLKAFQTSPPSLPLLQDEYKIIVSVLISCMHKAYKICFQKTPRRPLGFPRAPPGR